MSWFDARGELRGVCLFRCCAGPLVWIHLWPYFRAALSGSYYRDSFYVPWLSGYPEPSLPVYQALLTAALLAACALSLGWHARVASWICFGVVAYHFFLSETFFHHNRVFLLVFLGGLSLTPCGDALSLDALRRDGPPPLRPLWPLWLWRAEACVPYLASSVSKWLDPDWRAGIVTWDRVERHKHLAPSFVPGAWLELAASPELHFWLAKLVLTLELCVGIGLWLPRTRYAAVWLAVLFHTAIELSARVQVFSLLGIAGLCIWAVPATRDRRLQLPRGSLLARAVQLGDWLARFQVVLVDPGAAISLQERDGRVFTGRSAVLRTLARLPLTAFFMLPAIGFDLLLTARADPRAVPGDHSAGH